MKLLQELLGVKKFANKTAQQIIQDLQIDGIENTKIKFLGDGVNASVIKIGDYAYKFWYQDIAYEKFIEYAQNNPSKFLPKIYTVKTIPAFFLRAIEAPDRIKYAKIELLDKCNFDYKFKIGKDLIELRHLYKMHMNVYDTFEDSCVSAIRNFIDKNRRHFTKTLESLNYSSSYKLIDFLIDRNVSEAIVTNLDNDSREFLTIIYEIRKFIKDHNFQEDMHSGNILSRGDIPVIIDPMSSMDSLELNRIILKFDTAIKDGDFSLRGKSIERKF